MTASSGAKTGVVTTAAPPSCSDWREVHEALTRLARTRAGLDFEEGQRLRAAQLTRAHERLGFGSFVEYIERLFGYAPRLTLEKLRVAEALERLPALGDALRSGSASWSSLRELTRVATSETQRQWLAASRGKTVRAVERLVSGYRPGDLPDGPKDARAQRCRPEPARPLRHARRFGGAIRVGMVRARDHTHYAGALQRSEEVLA